MVYKINHIYSHLTYIKGYIYEAVGGEREPLYYLIEFSTLKKREEYIVDFNKRFNKMHNKIPEDIRPSHAATKVTYVRGFDPKFVLTLK